MGVSGGLITPIIITMPMNAVRTKKRWSKNTTIKPIPRLTGALYVEDGRVYGRLGMDRSDRLVFRPFCLVDDEARVQTTIVQQSKFSGCCIQIVLGAPPPRDARDAVSRPLSDFWDDACPGPALHPYLKYWKYPDRDRLESAALGGNVLRVTGTKHHAKQIRACMASEAGRRRAGPCDLISLETFKSKDGTEGFCIKIRAPKAA